MKKPGIEIKMTSERLVFFGIVLLVAGFIIFMPTIYKAFDGLKNNGNIKYNDNTIDTTDDTDVTVDPTGDTTAICSLAVTETNGETNDKYTFYYTNNKLTSYVLEKVYTANTQEYQNYVFSEQVIYNNLKINNKDLEGFSVVTTLETMKLTAEITFDLSKIDVTKASTDLTSYLTLTKNQAKTEVEAIYIEKGYTCK